MNRVRMSKENAAVLADYIIVMKREINPRDHAKPSGGKNVIAPTDAKSKPVEILPIECNEVSG